MKRVISIMRVLTMLMSLNTSAFAAVRPANTTATSALADVFSGSTGDKADIEDAGDLEETNVFDAETHDSQIMKKQIATIAEYESAQMIGNDYIQFCVADVDNTENSGRFTIGNTGGNPNYASDDNKILLFGHPSPWSSYTTIRIDTRNYIFMADHTTYDTDNLRAVSTMTVENILVTQILQIVENEGTGLADTVQITYTAENQSNSSKNVAIRIMLDTMLGYNDGAPFKVPSLGNVTLEKELSGNAIPAFWQAFDSLDDASVFAIGTLYKGGDRRPDKVQYTAWGSVYTSKHAWNYIVKPVEKRYGNE